MSGSHENRLSGRRRGRRGPPAGVWQSRESPSGRRRGPRTPRCPGRKGRLGYVRTHRGCDRACMVPKADADAPKNREDRSVGSESASRTQDLVADRHGVGPAHLGRSTHPGRGNSPGGRDQWLTGRPGPCWAGSRGRPTSTHAAYATRTIHEWWASTTRAGAASSPACAWVRMSAARTAITPVVVVIHGWMPACPEVRHECAYPPSARVHERPPGVLVGLRALEEGQTARRSPCAWGGWLRRDRANDGADDRRLASPTRSLSTRGQAHRGPRRPGSAAPAMASLPNRRWPPGCRDRDHRTVRLSDL